MRNCDKNYFVVAGVVPVCVAHCVILRWERRRRPLSEISQTPRGESESISPASTRRRRTNCARLRHLVSPETVVCRSISVRRAPRRFSRVLTTSRVGARPPRSSKISRIGTSYSESGTSKPRGTRLRFALTFRRLFLALDFAEADLERGRIALGASSGGRGSVRSKCGSPRMPTWSARPNNRRSTELGVSTKGSALRFRAS